MAHEIRRVLRAFASQPWFIDPRKAEQIVAALELRATMGPRETPYRAERDERPPVQESAGRVAVLRLYGPIYPRAEALEDVSQSAALLSKFRAAFETVARDPNVTAIILDIDSPGGRVDHVPETAAMIRNARREGRPIVAVANSLAASAAYWIASAADELVVTPSGEVGSIGVYMVHEDMSDFMEAMGVRVTFISEGARKVEGNPFEPLGDEARKALQSNVKYFYDLFVSDVAKNRGVSRDVVRADPETADVHFGGGRVYPASQAVKLGMADRVDTLENTIARMQRGGRSASRRKADTARKRLALL